MAGKKSNTSTKKAEPRNPNERMGEHLRELTAIHAHTDALALALAGNAGEGFRDGELTAILFDIEERLMHVRDGIESLTDSNFLARGEKKHSAGKAVHHG